MTVEKEWRWRVVQYEHLIVESADSNVRVPVREIFDASERNARVARDSLALVESPNVYTVVVDLPVSFVTSSDAVISNPVSCWD
jgi:hypothetical protein